jgi:hypothetical protein
MIGRKWLAMIVLCMPVAAMAQSVEADAEAIIASIRTPRDVLVAFSEERMSPLLAEPMQLSGVVEFGSDGTLSKRISEPFSELISISSRKVVLERNGRRRNINMRRDSELWRFYASLRAMLAGDLDGISEHYSLQVVKPGRVWKVALHPVANNTSGALVPMIVSGRDGRIERVETRQSDDNWQVLTFSRAIAE